MIQPTRTRVRAAGATDSGRVRETNEDRLHVDAERGIFLVVDGVGGHAAGEVAAGIARDIIVERLERATCTPAQRIREAIALANNEILRQAQASPARAGMTCVVTVALVEHGRLTIGHVGDTRLYALSPESIAKLTHDHSPIGEREDAGEISEADAMHHPRRNEVFRDVGSALHGPDDEDFIEVIERAFQPQQALLLCSDGLSDMLTSTAIERTIGQHTGNPAAVAQALIEAANEAGGKDNVTVVYVEGARFAPRSLLRGISGRLAASRVVWLTVGMLAGLALGLGLALTLGLDSWRATGSGRRLVVGGDGPRRYASITEAVAASRPRDVIRVEPGDYAEAVVLPPDVDLVARTPGTVTLVAPVGRQGWVAVTAGELGNHISGIRVLGRADAPIAVGFRLTGRDLAVDDVTVEGDVDLGMDILNDGAMLVRSSRFSGIRGLSLRIGPMARPEIRQNVFTRSAIGPSVAGRSVTEPRPAALDVAADAAPHLAGNFFVGYVEAGVVRGGATDTDRTRIRELLHGSYVITGQDHGK